MPSESFIIAVAPSIKQIHQHWSYIEKELFAKMEQIEVEYCDPKDLLVYLLKEFESLSHCSESRGRSMSIDESNLKTTLYKLFNLQESIISRHSCSHANQKGTFCILENHICFFSLSMENNVKISFKDVVEISHAPSKIGLFSENISICSSNETMVCLSLIFKPFNFVFYFQWKQVYESLVQLSNSAMKKLVKGTESQINLRNTRSMTEMHSPDVIYEDSEGDHVAIEQQLQSLENFKSIQDLEGRKKDVKFRATFNLMPSESILNSFQCSLISPQKYNGILFLSQRYLCFLSDRAKIVVELSKIDSIKKISGSIISSLFGSPSLVIVLKIGRILEFSAFEDRDAVYDSIMFLLREQDYEIKDEIDDESLQEIVGKACFDL